MLASVVLLLLRGVEGVAALLSRITLAAFALLHRLEILIGIGLGILIEQVDGLPAAERATVQGWSRTSPAAPSSAPSS
jgi:hypothetical protein